MSSWVEYDRIAEFSTTTGSGDLVLSGAINPGYWQFGDMCGNGDAFYYLIEELDGDGVPTANWESGIGHWNSGANSITRDHVYNGAAITFAAGTRRISMSATGPRLAFKGSRVRLNAALTSVNFAGASYHTIAFDTQDYGTPVTSAFWTIGSPTKLILPSIFPQAWMRLRAQIGLEQLTTGSVVEVAFNRNSSFFATSVGGGYAAMASPGAAGDPLSIQVQTSTFLTNGSDEFEVIVRTGADSSCNVLAGSWFEMEVVAPRFSF
jgi:hypothetical protein